MTFALGSQLLIVHLGPGAEFPAQVGPQVHGVAKGFVAHEAHVDLVDLPGYRQVVQQANAQGMTWFAAAGDQGAADCEDQGADIAQNGLAAEWLPKPSAEQSGFEPCARRWSARIFGASSMRAPATANAMPSSTS